MHAKIHWKRQEEGGRARPPSGIGPGFYAPLVRFTDSNEPWPTHDQWSLIVEKVPALSTDYEWTATVHFLVQEAPSGELRPNRQFELYEGRKCVATGILVEQLVAAEP